MFLGDVGHSDPHDNYISSDEVYCMWKIMVSYQVWAGIGLFLVGLDLIVECQYAWCEKWRVPVGSVFVFTALLIFWANW